MKVSIIIPVYNAERTISATVDSLLAQTYKNIEVIVVDDGSNDKTAQILNKYENKIRIIHQKNRGVSSARNRGIEEAVGTYLIFVDADDLCDRDMVESLVHEISLKHVDFVIAGMTKIYINREKEILFGNSLYRGQEVIRSNLETILKNGLNWPVARIYCKRLIQEYHIRFDEKLPLGEDFNFNLEYLLCANSVAYLNKSVYKYLVFNSVATTMYREDMHLRRMLSLEKMNNTFARNGLVNPLEGMLRIKIFYAEMFNLQKKMCPYSYCQKMKILKNMKAKYLRESDKNLSGIYKVLRLMVKVLPAWALYTFGLCVQTIMNILPEGIRGLSV